MDENIFLHYIIRHKLTKSNIVHEKPLPIFGIKPVLKKKWDEKNIIIINQRNNL